MTPSEFKYKMRQINLHFERAEEIFNSLPAGIQAEIQDYHRDECTIGHCVRWGLQATIELFQNAKAFLKKAKENGAI